MALTFEGMLCRMLKVRARTLLTLARSLLTLARSLLTLTFEDMHKVRAEQLYVREQAGRRDDQVRAKET